MLDAALEVECKTRRLMIQLGRPFPEILRLQTLPGVGRDGAHLFVAYIQEPGRFATAQQLYRYCRLGIRDRTSDGKPLGYQRLDRTGSALHARLNTQRKVLHTLLVLWREGRQLEPQRFLGNEPQPTAQTSCG